MKGLVGFVVMFMALSAWAEAWLPDVKYLIKPDFPNELRYAGSDGEVRLKVVVKADGSVVDPKIVYSSHPLFAGAALKVIGEWRFSSRPLTGDNPQELEVFVPMVFEYEPVKKGKQSDQPLDLVTATCLQLNREIDRYVRSDTKIPLANVTLFRLTQKHLIAGLVDGKYDNESLTLGLFDLSQGMIKVAKTCQRRSSRKFVDLLPPSVKALLESGGMAIKRE